MNTRLTQALCAFALATGAAQAWTQVSIDYLQPSGTVSADTPIEVWVQVSADRAISNALGDTLRTGTFLLGTYTPDGSHATGNITFSVVPTLAFRVYGTSLSGENLVASIGPTGGFAPCEGLADAGCGFTRNVSAVPEASTLSMLLLGVGTRGVDPGVCNSPRGCERDAPSLFSGARSFLGGGPSFLLGAPSFSGSERALRPDRLCAWRRPSGPLRPLQKGARCRVQAQQGCARPSCTKLGRPPGASPSGQGD